MKVRLNNGFKPGNNKSPGSIGHKNRFKKSLWDKWLCQLNNRKLDEGPHVTLFRNMLEFEHPTRIHELVNELVE